jgi:hypothetical protein
VGVGVGVNGFGEGGFWAVGGGSVGIRLRFGGVLVGVRWGFGGGGGGGGGGAARAATTATATAWRT